MFALYIAVFHLTFCSILLTLDETENKTIKIIAKTIAQCRGLEFPSLVTISNEGYRVMGALWKSSLLDVWTRVTSSLFVIHMKRSKYIFTDVLKYALDNQVAKNFMHQE